MNTTMKMNPTLVSSHMQGDQFVSGVKVNEVVEVFQGLGYECEVNSELVGTSGVKHPFDIVAKRDGEIIVADLVSFRTSILDTPLSDMEVTEKLQLAGITMRAKAWDCGVYQRFIIYLSSHLSIESDRKSKFDPYELFLQQSNINIVQSADASHAAEKLRTHLGTVETNSFTPAK